MTINNTANKVVAAGNGVMTVFNFSFVGVDAGDIEVIYTDANGNETTLAANQYTLTLNAAPPGQIWGIGGSVTYPLTGSPIALNTTLTILRTVPLLQKIALGNQGNEFPSAVETALDLVVMMVQQVNEIFQRAIVAPVVDPSTPLPLPPIAQRANMGMAFDANGNPIAASLPSSGVISSAMQPVVDAATLAAGRTAFGLGGMAVENIGGGLADDGSGNARVNLPISQVSTNQNVVAADYLNSFITTGPINFVYPRANTLFNGFGHWIYNTAGGAITLQIDSHDTFQGYSSGQSIEIPPNACAYVSTDAGTNGNWVVDWAMAGGPVVAGGSFSGLTLTNTSNATPNTHIDCSVSEFVLPSANNGTVRFAGSGLGFSINATTNGVNGLDTGSLAASTWYYIWAISNGATLAGLLSLSSTAPTLPTGYVFAKRVGAVLTDGSANFYRFLQKGMRSKYVVAGGGTNVPTSRAIINQSSTIGNPGAGTYVAASVSNFVPPTASQIHLIMSVATAGSAAPAAIGMVAPSANYGAYNSTTNPPPISSVTDATSNQQLTQTLSGSMMLESTNIYTAFGGNGNFFVACEGWTDNL